MIRGYMNPQESIRQNDSMIDSYISLPIIAAVFKLSNF
jgi:hypothetical protein